MTLEEERRALARSGMLPHQSEPDQTLWGIISGGKLEKREGILFLAGEFWGFYGRDFEFLTKYAGFFGRIVEIATLRGPLQTGEAMPVWQIEGPIETEGEQKYTFLPDAMLYRKRSEEVELFFADLRQRSSNLLQPQAEGPFQQALSRWEHGRLDETRELLQQSHRLDPRSALPPFFLGKLLLEEGDPDKAIAMFKESRQKGLSETVPLGISLAKAYLQKGEMRPAEQELRSVLQACEDAEAWFLLAQIDTAYQREREAIGHLKRAAALAPREPLYSAWLAYRAAHLGERAFAYQILQKWKAERPSGDPIWLLAEAEYAYQEGDLETARSVFQESLRAEPSLSLAKERLEEIRSLLPPPLVTKESVPPLSSEALPPPFLEDDLGSDTPSPSHDASLSPPPSSSLPSTDDPPADGLLQTLQDAVASFQEEDLPSICSAFQREAGTFCGQWGVYLLECLLHPESLDEAIQSLGKRLDEGIALQMETLFPVISEKLDFQRTALVALLSPPQGTVFLERALSSTLELRALLEQIHQYTLGLLDGGLLTIFLHDLTQEEAEPSAELLSSFLLARLSVIARKLRSVLLGWSESHLERWSQLLVELPQTTAALAASLLPALSPASFETPSLSDFDSEPLRTTALPGITGSFDQTTAIPSLFGSPSAGRDEGSRPSSYQPPSPTSLRNFDPLSEPDLPAVTMPAKPTQKPQPKTALPPAPAVIRAASILPPRFGKLAAGSTAVPVSSKYTTSSNPSFPSAPPPPPPLSSSPSGMPSPSLAETSALPNFPASATFPISSTTAGAAAARSARPTLSPPASSDPHPSVGPISAAAVLAAATSAAPSPASSGTLPAGVLPPSAMLKLQRAQQKPQDMSQYIKLYQEFAAAQRLLGGSSDGIDQEKFFRTLEHKASDWRQRHGTEPDFYIRIEDGKPQVKIRDKS